MDKGFRKAPLAFCRKLCYADRGATSSTPVGGSPGFLGGYTSLPPIERKGVVDLVTWTELIQFGIFLIALISLIRQDKENKK